MGERSIDRVQIVLSHTTVALPWSSQQELLEQLRRVESMREVVQAFEAVGTSCPVKLTSKQKSELLDVITIWASEADDGYDGLPDGIFELRNAIVDDG